MLNNYEMLSLIKTMKMPNTKRETYQTREEKSQRQNKCNQDSSSCGYRKNKKLIIIPCEEHLSTLSIYGVSQKYDFKPFNS